MGELRLGATTRRLSDQTVFDAFGTNGLGSRSTSSSAAPRRRPPDNSIGYFLPSNIGGFYGQAMVAASESGTSLDRGGRHMSGRIGFAAGPFDVSAAAGHQRLQATAIVKDLQRRRLVRPRLHEAVRYYQRDNTTSATSARPACRSEPPSTWARPNPRRLRPRQARRRVRTPLSIRSRPPHTTCPSDAMYGTVFPPCEQGPTGLALPQGITPITAGGDSKGSRSAVRHIF